jgi:hypothetical protein
VITRAAYFVIRRGGHLQSETVDAFRDFTA